jgi:hypothetical protein
MWAFCIFKVILLAEYCAGLPFLARRRQPHRQNSKRGYNLLCA